jgi:hypothetical protein
MRARGSEPHSEPKSRDCPRRRQGGLLRPRRRQMPDKIVAERRRRRRQVVAYTIMDIISKCVFTFMIVAAHDSLGGSTAQPTQSREYV